MMSQTNVDYLFQLTAPLPDRAPAASPLGQGRPAFNDHLALAGDTSRDRPGKGDIKPTLIDEPRPDDHRRLPTETTSERQDESETLDCATCGEPDTLAGDARAETASLEDSIEADSGDSKLDRTDSHKSDGPRSEGDDNATDVWQDAAELPATTLAVAEAAAALPDLTPAEISNEANMQDTAAAFHATTGEHGEKYREPNKEAAAELPATSDPISNVRTNRNAKLNPAQQANPAAAISSGAATEGTVAESTISGAPDTEKSHQPGKSKDTEPEAPSNKRQQPTDLATSDPLKVSADGRVKAQKLSAPGRRASEKTTTDASHGRAGSHVESGGKSSAPADKAVVAAIANQIAAPPAVTIAGNPAADEGASTSTKTSGHSEALTQSGSRASRGAGVAGGARRMGVAESMPRIEASRFVGRVAKAVQTAHERGGALQLRLSPPELGSLRLELHVQNGAMTASLETETATARQVLLDHLPALRERLADQNIRIERFDVDVRQEGSGGQADPRESQHQDRQRQPHTPPPRQAFHRHQADDAEHRGPALRYPGQANSRINILA